MTLGREYKHGECLFLTVILNHLSQSLLSVKKEARDSVSPLISQYLKQWEEYLEHQQAGIMQLDAYLVQYLLDVGEFDKDEIRKEEEFTEIIGEFRMYLDDSVNVLLDKCTTTSPFRWDKLTVLLSHLQQGDTTVLNEEEIDIPYLKDLIQLKAPERFFQNTEKMSDIDKSSEISRLLRMLQLEDHYPAKICLDDVMSVGKLNRNSRVDVPWTILQKLIMLDRRVRDTVVQVDETDGVRGLKKEYSEDFDIEELFRGCESQSENKNPMDLFHVIFLCSDLMLRQTLVQKMFQCRLALLFIFPEVSDELCFSLWALRSIAFECRDEENEVVESFLVSQPLNVVSFVRLGRPKFSKSKFINSILSDQAHSTFFNSDCVGGNTEKSLASGLVESSFFFPSVKGDPFNVTMFLNLRGESIKYEKQLEIMSKISNIVVACIDDSDLSDTSVVETMKSLYSSTSKVVLLVVDEDVDALRVEKFRETCMKYASAIGKENMAGAKNIFGFKNKKEKNAIELRKEIREVLVNCLEPEQKKTIMDATQFIKQSMKVDEYIRHCKRGKEFADQVLSTISGKSPILIKRQMLQLQGEHWQEWNELLKAQNRSHGTQESSSIQERGKIQEAMTRLRRE